MKVRGHCRTVRQVGNQVSYLSRLWMGTNATQTEQNRARQQASPQVYQELTIFAHLFEKDLVEVQ